MNKNKSLLVLMIVLALLALQVGAAYAAPAQDPLPDGTIVSVTQTTDAGGATVFEVVVKDSTGTDQTVILTPAEAEAAGLVTANTDGTFTIKAVAGNTITGGVLVTPCTSTEGNIVASAIAAFFCANGSTVLNDSVDALHTEGFGFGEITQACFMAEVLGSTCGEILDAKKNHDFTNLILPGDVSVSNWGQLKKVVLTQEVKSLTNLGAIMSGRATPPAMTETPAPPPTGPLSPDVNGKGKGNGKGNGGGNGNGGGKPNKP